MRFLPGYKATFLIVGSLFIFLSLMIFVRGLIPSMAEFKVPDSTLNSPHYFDAILWVYTHMMVMGLLIFTLAFSVPDRNKQKWISILLLLITSAYTFLDFRSSDSALGNGLYQGEASLIPAIISLFCSLMFCLTVIKFLGSKEI